MKHSEYILTHRLGGNRLRGSHAEGAEALDHHLAIFEKYADVIHDSHAGTTRRKRRIVRLAAPRDLISRHAKGLHPDIILEPRVFFRPHVSSRLLGGGREMAHVTPATSADVAIEVIVRSGDMPLADAEVSLLYQTSDGQHRMLPQQLTDAEGRVRLQFASDCKALLVGAYPAHGYWSACRSQPRGTVELDCRPLPSDGPLAWWHRAMGISEYRPETGRGIRVGLLGTGVTPHPCLSHIHRLDNKDDLNSHGTHVCGIIGARPNAPGQVSGFAPGATIFTRRVFELENGAVVLPDQGVLAHGIEEFSADADDATRVDLINMSLGGSPSQCVTDAVLHAREHGTVCVCSAGNSSGAVEFPASMSQTIGVAALGKWGWGPDNSITVHMTPDPNTQANFFGEDDLYLASFSCFGPTVAAAAPGAGVISTVPPRLGASSPYAAMDGTSLSSPAVCGLLAVLLSRSEAYKKMPRDSKRADEAWELFRRHCIDIGLADTFQGQGMPSSYPPEKKPIRSRRPSKRESPRKGPKPGITLE